MYRPAPPRVSGSCFYCNSKRVKCDATLEGGSYPCKRCIDKNQDLTLCGPHLEDPRWIPGVSGATHARGGEASGTVRKTTKATLAKSPKKTTPRKSTPTKASPKKAAPKKATPKKATPKKATPKMERPSPITPLRSSRRLVESAAINSSSGQNHSSDYNSSDDNEPGSDEAEDQDQGTVASRFRQSAREETERTGVNPMHTLWQQQADEWRAVQRLTLGELRTARAEERLLMGQDGMRRVLSPPPGPDDAVYGELMRFNTRGTHVPVKPQQPDQDDY